MVRSVAVYSGSLELAQDATQEAFARALVRWRVVSGYDRPGAWVRRVALRCVTRHRRRSDSERRARERLAPPAGNEIEQSIASADVARAIATLPRRQRAAVVLRYYEQLDIDEIAAVLGTAPAPARVHLHRARARLAVLLAEEPDDVERLATS